MKRLAALLLLACVLVPSQPALADDYPAPDGYVVDAAGVIPPATEARLEAELRDYDRRTTNQVAIAVVRTLDGASLEDYATGLFNTWGIGQASKDNGVLLLLAISEHQDRIEVGRGLTSTLTDGQASEILGGQVMAAAKAGDFAAAALRGERAIRRALGDTTAVTPGARPGSGEVFAGGQSDGSSVPADPPDQSGITDPGADGIPFAPQVTDSSPSPLLLLIPFGGLAVLALLARLLGFGGPGGRNRRAGGFAGFFASRPLDDGRTHDSFGSSSGFTGMGGSNGDSGGGGGGGGGGFGGGGSDGGGASGGW